MIEAGTYPVGDVGLLVGYENFSAFSTAFKKHFGRSPSAIPPGAGRPRRVTRAPQRVHKVAPSTDRAHLR